MTDDRMKKQDRGRGSGGRADFQNEQRQRAPGREPQEDHGEQKVGGKHGDDYTKGDRQRQNQGFERKQPQGGHR
jgi:hypothetical protein